MQGWSGTTDWDTVCRRAYDPSAAGHRVLPHSCGDPYPGRAVHEVDDLRLIALKVAVSRCVKAETAHFQSSLSIRRRRKLSPKNRLPQHIGEARELGSSWRAFVRPLRDC